MRGLKVAATALCGLVLSVMAVTAFSVPLNENAAITAYPLLAAGDTGADGLSVTGLFRNGRSLFDLLEPVCETLLVPLGMPFGIKLYTEGVMVVGFTDVETASGSLSPCRSAGLRKSDMIISVGKRRISSNEELSALVEGSGGSTLEIEYKRSGAIYTVSVAPARQTDGIWKLGVWVRDSAAGIGTVTFVNPVTGAFGGLGHGICDVDTGSLMPLGRASVYRASIDGVTAGRRGVPGELTGRFSSSESWGILTVNAANGVYGSLSGDFSRKKAFPVATYSEIRTGPATVITTVSGSEPEEYAVKIERVSPESDGEKNFVIRITDERLLEVTNGIVQGMSGSPLIQNGKIIGAVTHVLVNEPQKGYGIYIGTMLAMSRIADRAA